MGEKSKGTGILGRYFEDNIGAYVLWKLCELKNVYDWSFGMERKEFVKFDDVVVGIQRTEHDEMGYYAIQLKSYDDEGGADEKGYHIKHLFPELVGWKQAGNMSVRKNFYIDGFKNIKQELRAQVKNFVLYLQFHFEQYPDENEQYVAKMSQRGAKYFALINSADLGDLRHILPTSPNGQYRKLSETAISELLESWGDEDMDQAREFLQKLLIISGQPSPHDIHNVGKEFEHWDLLRIKGYDQKVKKLKEWVSKKNLMDHLVMFQGRRDCLIKIGDIIDEPNTELLIKLFRVFANQEALSIGKEVRGLEEGLYIERRLILCHKDMNLYLSEEQLLKERIVVVEGEPGLGKSFALLHAAKSLKMKVNNLWVVELNAAKATEIFSRMTPDEGPLAILEEVVVQGDSYIERLCFKKLINNPKRSVIKIALFLDGLDEITTALTERVVEWLGTISEFLAIRTIWIGTRTYLREVVEKACKNAKVVTLEQFTRSDMIRFFGKSWDIPEDSKIMATLMKRLDDHPVSDELKAFIGVPLMTSMMAASYNENVQKIKNGVLSADKWELLRINVISLFKHFRVTKCREQDAKEVTVNFKCPYKEREYFQRLQANFDRDMGLLSMHHIFHCSSQEFNTIMSPEEKDVIKRLLESAGKPDQLTSGFVKDQTNGQLVFIHQIFAEFDAALWLFTTLEKLEDEEKAFGRQPSNFIENSIKALTISEANQNAKSAIHTKSPRLQRLKAFMHANHMKPEFDMVKFFLGLLAAEGNEKQTGAVMKLFSMETERYSNPDPNYIKLNIWCGFPKYFREVKKMKVLQLPQLEGWKGRDKLGRSSTHVALEYDRLHLAAKCQENSHPTLPKVPTFWDIVLRERWLLVACINGDEELARRALEVFGADVNYDPGDQEVIGLTTPLHLASEYGHTEIVRVLLGQGANIEIRNGEKETPLFNACRYSKTESATFLLHKGADSNAISRFGQTPLHLACSAGNKDIVRLLLDKGCDINVSDCDGDTPLHAACPGLTKRDVLSQNMYYWNFNREVFDLTSKVAVEDDHAGRADIVQLLLGKGADAKARNSEGATPLHLACYHGNREVIKLLVEAGASFDCRDEVGQTALDHAYRPKESNEALLWLLDNNYASVNLRNERGWTLLHAASAEGDIETANQLLERGAKLCVDSNCCRFPLHIACYYKHHEVASLLLKKMTKAEVNMGTIFDESPLHMACMAKGFEDVQVLHQLFKASEADADTLRGRVDGKHQPPVEDDDPKIKPNLELVRLLVEQGANVDAADVCGYTPLLVAYQANWIEIVNYLVEVGADVNLANNRGHALLHRACLRGDIDTVSMLIRKKADLNKKDIQGNTPLHIAYAMKETALVELLVESGADPYKRNSKNQRPEESDEEALQCPFPSANMGKIPVI